MIKQSIQIVNFLIITLFSLQVFAEDIIQITVKTDEKTATCIGYSVEGKDYGGAGKSYEGEGPKDKKYSFGYRKNVINGINVSCGALILTKNSNVMLITDGNKCHSVIKP